jgi:hypothetical protein
MSTFSPDLAFPPTQPGNARYVIDPDDVRRGPYEDIVLNPSMNIHGVDVIFSPVHRRSEMCASCHDLSNPVYERQPDGTYALGTLNAPHSTMDIHDMMPEQRTYSEWLNSTFATTGVAFSDGRFGGNHPTGIMKECQDCHMPDTVAGGCFAYFVSPWFIRDDLPQHRIVGANTWVLRAIRDLYPDSETNLSEEAVALQEDTTRELLRAASDAQALQQADTLKVRIINFSGHKLPTGYPEGRRMWLNVQYYDKLDEIVAEHGGYDFDTAVLDESDTKVYRMEAGITPDVAGALNLPAGKSFHLVLNNEIISDNRIPPMGFTNAAYEAARMAPVDYAYEDGQYWGHHQLHDSVGRGAGRGAAVLPDHHQGLHRVPARHRAEWFRPDRVRAVGRSARGRQESAGGHGFPRGQPPAG